VLKKGGVPDERVVVMVYDDLAQNSENPRPGQLFNHPDGADVYAGLPKDYTGPQVNAANFLAVLEGNAVSARGAAQRSVRRQRPETESSQPAPRRPLGLTLPPPARPQSAVHAGPHSTGRVIAAGPLDRVFVYFSDHGAPGILGMPAGAFLYADELHGAIRRRRRAGRFAEMVLYIEACESGSLFDGLLERDLRVYATTAANGRESSWGVYCPASDCRVASCPASALRMPPKQRPQAPASS
jgi:legumain